MKIRKIFFYSVPFSYNDGTVMSVKNGTLHSALERYKIFELDFTENLHSVNINKHKSEIVVNNANILNCNYCVIQDNSNVFNYFYIENYDNLNGLDSYRIVIQRDYFNSVEVSPLSISQNVVVSRHNNLYPFKDVEYVRNRDYRVDDNKLPVHRELSGFNLNGNYDVLWAQFTTTAADNKIIGKGFSSTIPYRNSAALVGDEYCDDLYAFVPFGIVDRSSNNLISVFPHSTGGQFDTYTRIITPSTTEPIYSFVANYSRINTVSFTYNPPFMYNLSIGVEDGVPTFDIELDFDVHEIQDYNLSTDEAKILKNCVVYVPIEYRVKSKKFTIDLTNGVWYDVYYGGSSLTRYNNGIIDKNFLYEYYKYVNGSSYISLECGNNKIDFDKQVVKKIDVEVVPSPHCVKIMLKVEYFSSDGSSYISLLPFDIKIAKISGSYMIKKDAQTEYFIQNSVVDSANLNNAYFEAGVGIISNVVQKNALGVASNIKGIIPTLNSWSASIQRSLRASDTVATTSNFVTDNLERFDSVRIIKCVIDNNDIAFNMFKHWYIKGRDIVENIAFPFITNRKYYTSIQTLEYNYNIPSIYSTEINEIMNNGVDIWYIDVTPKQIVKNYSINNNLEV